MPGTAKVAASSNQGTLRVVDTTIRGNRADRQGGGIFNEDQLTITGSTLADNRAADGAGILNTNRSWLSFAELSNVTLSDNEAESNGGGVYNAALLRLQWRRRTMYSAVPKPTIPAVVFIQAGPIGRGRELGGGTEHGRRSRSRCARRTSIRWATI